MAHVIIDYTNYRGERSHRRIRAHGRVVFASNEWHPEKQWIMEGFDLDKNAVRFFAMKDIHASTLVDDSDWLDGLPPADDRCCGSENDPTRS
jgi:predicted DNA-binding transcriptional regulator YafY